MKIKFLLLAKDADDIYRKFNGHSWEDYLDVEWLFSVGALSQ